MARLAGFSSRQVTRKLLRLGFEFDRQARGSHEIWGIQQRDIGPLFPTTLEICRKERYRRF